MFTPSEDELHRRGMRSILLSQHELAFSIAFYATGRDTILRIPQRTNDEDGFIREIQHHVAKVYFAGDAYGGDDRIEYIRRELAPLSEG